MMMGFIVGLRYWTPVDVIYLYLINWQQLQGIVSVQERSLFPLGRERLDPATPH